MQRPNRLGLEPRSRDYGKGRRTWSRFKGVSYQRRKRVFVAFVILDGRQIHVCSMPPTPEGELEAARLRDYVLRRHGVLAGLNFPND
jgi:hypothetical protein